MEAEEEEATPEVAGGKPGATRDRFTIDEFRTAIDQLSPDDKMKLHLIERRLLSGTGLAQGDLVHDAICKGLLGDRPWPRDVPIMAWIVMTMKSVASHAREAELAARKAEPEVVLAAGSARPMPDDAVVQSQAAAAIAAITSALDGDDEAQLVLLGWADGLRGKALRELVGCDQAKLDYAIKRVRRTAMTLYPDGWPL